MCIKVCKWLFLFCELSHIPDAAPPLLLLLLSAPAHPYLELTSEVVICDALSALLQRNESEASEISRAGCQEDHCKAEKRVFVMTWSRLYWHIRVSLMVGDPWKMQRTHKHHSCEPLSVWYGRVRAVNSSLASQAIFFFKKMETINCFQWVFSSNCSHTICEILCSSSLWFNLVPSYHLSFNLLPALRRKTSILSLYLYLLLWRIVSFIDPHCIKRS